MRGIKEPAVVCLIVAACLLPFAGKAFSVDDPLFLWAAAQIREHPLDAYGFSVNWYGTDQAMWTATHNPPLASYYIAAASLLFGTSEIALHLALLLPAIGAILGTWKLSQLVTPNQLVAAFAALATPAFLASSTSVMCDTLMVCLFVWAVVLWIDGLRFVSPARLLAASILVAAAALTKYFALSLLPLLVVCTITIDRRQWRSVFWLLISLAIFAAYESWTWALYGTVHVLHATFIAVGVERGGSLLAKTAVGLSFAGGSFLSIVFFAPLIFSKRVLALAALLAIAVAVYVKEIAWQPGLGAISYHQRMTWEAAAQLGLFIGAGALVLWLAVPDFRAMRTQPLLLTLSLWIAGTYVFAAYLNWGCNVRSMLPMAPALGILIARRIEAGRLRLVPFAAIPAIVVSLAVAHADYTLANSWRDLADFVAAESGSKTLWFEGHWGFQYYLQNRGARPVDFLDTKWRAGDLIAVPFGNADTRDPPEGSVAPVATQVEVPGRWWIAVMSKTSGAGFHSSFFGPMPFAVADPESQRCAIYTAIKPATELPKGVADR